MSTHQWQILISAYADGELSPEDIARAERVLQEDPKAREYLAQIRRMSSFLRVDSDAEVSPDLNNKVLTALVREGKMERKTNWRVASGVLTLCVMVIVGSVSFNAHIKQGMQGRMMTAYDDVGEQYDPSKVYVLKQPSPVTATIVPAAARNVLVAARATIMKRESIPVSAIVASGSSYTKSVGSMLSPDNIQYVPLYQSSSYSVREDSRFEKGWIYDAPVQGFRNIWPDVDEGQKPLQHLQNEPANTEEYNTITENAFLEASREPLSTFSIDVDTASYTNLRRFIKTSQLPPRDAVRIEEMINYFGYDYPRPEGDEPFSITTKVAVCPWNTGHQLVLIGLKGRTPDLARLAPSSLTFLLDISGSMDSSDKLPLIQQAFTMMVRQLRSEDKVAIVVYAGSQGVVLDSTSGAEKDKIIYAINNLRAGGSTAGGAGIRKAYEIAEKNFIKDGNNRVILATDGDFNVGVSSTSEMVSLIEERRDKGIFLTVIGVGSDGNLKDGRLSQIADKGNGSYHYFDSIQEAKKVFLTELGSTLFTIAKDVKIQVEFNPTLVKGYRLIGYEKRKLNNEDFNNDQKDAGELGAGHTVTALYEIVPAGSTEVIADVDVLKYQKVDPSVQSSDEVMTVKLRYKAPGENVSKLMSKVLKKSEVHDQPQGDFAFAAAVAEFGMLLRDSEFKGKSDVEQVLEMARAAKGDDKFGYRAEFISLVETAETLGIPAKGNGMQFK